VISWMGHLVLRVAMTGSSPGQLERRREPFFCIDCTAFPHSLAFSAHGLGQQKIQVSWPSGPWSPLGHWPVTSPFNTSDTTLLLTNHVAETHTQ